MQKLLLIFAMAAILTSGCKKVDELTQFEMDYKESITVPASSGINLPFNLFTPEMETNAQSTFAINDTRKDLIEEIKLTRLYMDITSPTDGDFRFLQSVSVFISAEGLSEIEVASKNPVPANVGPTLELDVSDNDLQEYIKKDQFSLRVNTVTDEFLSEDYVIDVNATFFVDAKILGQ